MEEDRVEDKSSSPLPTSAPINWALITGPVPEPVFPASSVSPQPPPPPHTPAVPSLQTEVKSFPQRMTRGMNREKEVEREETGVLASSPIGQISSEVPLRQRPRGNGQVSLPQSRAAKNLSSSDEGEEVEVQVRLEIHSPPAEAQGEQMFQGGVETDKEWSERREGQGTFMTGQSCFLGECVSLESLLSVNPINNKDEPSTHRPSTLSSSSPAISNSTSSSSSSSTPYMSTRHWAPPKGFWRVVQQETLLLNGAGPHKIPYTVPLKDYTQLHAPEELQRKSKPESSALNNVSGEVEDSNADPEFKHYDSVEHFLDRGEQKEADTGDKGLCSSDSWESTSSQSGLLSTDEKLKVKQRAYAKLRERQQNCRKERELSKEQSSYYRDTKMDLKVACVHGILDSSDTAIVTQELKPYLRSLIIRDELPLSPRHEQAKRLLERARLKARSSHINDDGPCRSSHSDHKATVKKQQFKSPSPVLEQKAVQTNEDVTAQTVSGPFLVPTQRETSPGEHGGRFRRYGCSPTRVRFEDESEKEAESRYLDRVRHRGRTGVPKSKSKESNTDSSGSGSERSRSHRSVSMPAPQKKDEVGVSSETTTVIKEVIVLVKKCEACGSVVREPQPVFPALAPQNTEAQQPGNPEDPQGKSTSRCVPSHKPEGSTRPKASLTVTFAGAYVLGENEESSTGWKSSGFGKLRRRSRKGESRLESGHGPYGPSWAQRRNSNPRNRINTSRAVSFDPGSPITLEPSLLEASDRPRELPAPSLPIKSALKSSSRNRSAAGQPTVQFQIISNQGEEGGSQHPVLQDSPDTRIESLVSLTQGTPAMSNPCIRPFTQRYSPARLNTDLPAAEHWDATSDATGLGGDPGSGPECCSALRGLSRAEDLRAELLRSEHLKAEAMWEENSDGSSRKLDGRPKLFLRRFFSSIGLNSVGRLVKGGRSNSMEQLSIPTATRASSASPSPTRRPQPTIRIQRTPSLQALHTVLPLAQLRKASSVQSLERRTERSTILGEVQIPYGLAPSPQLELDRALSVDEVLASRIVRPVSRVTQAFPDGTLLLELTRPPNGPFGFVISRGKGRPDTGVYVEKVVDGNGEGPYVGLLGIGDEILEVNGEAVAGLSLDQVTRLMTRESTASLRIMPARRTLR